MYCMPVRENKSLPKIPYSSATQPSLNTAYTLAQQMAADSEKTSMEISAETLMKGTDTLRTETVHQ